MSEIWKRVVPEQSRKGRLIEEGSADCQEQTQYRWVNLNPRIDYYCEYVPPTPEPQYRWVNLDPTVSGNYYCDTTTYTKYYKQQRQVSYDGGTTWQNVSPAEYQRGSAYETQSTDCGYVPPTPTPYEQQYLTFVAQENGTIQYGNIEYEVQSTPSVDYSLDGGNTWNTLLYYGTVNLSQGQKILWKGTFKPQGGTYVLKFNTSMRFNVEGNIMSLIYGDDFVDKTSLTGTVYTFEYLFNGCSGLTSAENLILPATELVHSCYAYMFNNCTSLTKAPALPAINLAKRCYSCMFSDCALTTAPVLLASVINENSYNYMFENCPLNYIKCLATDRRAFSSTNNWLSGVPSTGTFVKAASMNDWPSGASGIPSGWTVENA